MKEINRRFYGKPLASVTPVKLLCLKGASIVGDELGMVTNIQTVTHPKIALPIGPRFRMYILLKRHTETLREGHT